MLVGYHQTVRTNDESRSAAPARDDLHHTCLNTLNDVRERGFTLVGQVCGSNELDIDDGFVLWRGSIRGGWHGGFRGGRRRGANIGRGKGFSTPAGTVTASRANQHKQ